MCFCWISWVQTIVSNPPDVLTTQTITKRNYLKGIWKWYYSPATSLWDQWDILRFDYSMSVFQATARQNVIHIVGPVPNTNEAGFSSVQTCLWLLTQVHQSYTSNTCRCIHISGCPDLRTVFSHAWDHIKKMAYDWQAAMRWTISTSSSYIEYVMQQFRVIDSVAEQSRLWINNDCSHTEHPSQNELLECDNYFMDTMKCRIYVHFQHSVSFRTASSMHT